MATAEMMARRFSNHGDDTDTPELFQKPASTPKKRRAPNRKPTRSPEDLPAYAILEAAFPVIEAHLGQLDSMSPKLWRQYNKRAALDLHACGRTPDDVAKMLKMAFMDRFYPKSPMLAKLQEHWPAVRARLKERNGTAPVGPKKLSRDQVERLR
jgi:hypothetical protein